MGESKLSHKLLEMGFFWVLGTSEHPGMTSESHRVRRGAPNTWGSNNGVTVVYDEEGRPWIIRRGREISNHDFDEKILFAHNLKRGAYVPHSNDGGWFVTEVILGL